MERLEQGLEVQDEKMTRSLLAFENRDDDKLRLGTAIPAAWLTDRMAFRNASTQ